jgi:hypothetical protein
MAWSFLTATKNARADAVTTQIATGGKLAIYSTGYAVKLAEWTWTANMFPAASAGALAMNAPTTNPMTPVASGTAAIARVSKADGTTFIISDLTVGISGADVVISNTAISTSTPVTLNSFTSTEAA